MRTGSLVRRLDARTTGLLHAAGYRFAFTSQHGCIGYGRSRNCLMLPRIKVEAGDPAWLFPKLCDGALDGWRYVDTLLWRAQQVR